MQYAPITDEQRLSPPADFNGRQRVAQLKTWTKPMLRSLYVERYGDPPFTTDTKAVLIDAIVSMEQSAIRTK